MWSEKPVAVASIHRVNEENGITAKKSYVIVDSNLIKANTFHLINFVFHFTHVFYSIIFARDVCNTFPVLNMYSLLLCAIQTTTATTTSRETYSWERQREDESERAGENGCNVPYGVERVATVHWMWVAIVSIRCTHSAKYWCEC